MTYDPDKRPFGWQRPQRPSVDSLIRRADQRAAYQKDPLPSKLVSRWFNGKQPVTIFSAADWKAEDASVSRAKERSRQLIEDVKSLNIPEENIKRVRGKWEDKKEGKDPKIRPEPSIMVLGLDFDSAAAIAEKYAQEAFIFKSEDGVIGMYNGPLTVNPNDRNTVNLAEPGLFGADAVHVEPSRQESQPLGWPTEEFPATKGRGQSLNVKFDWTGHP